MTTEGPSIDTLREIETRVLWLATRIIDAANRRADSDINSRWRRAPEFALKTLESCRERYRSARSRSLPG